MMVASREFRYSTSYNNTGAGRTHDGRIARVQVLHIVRQRSDVALAGDDDAAGHWGAHKLVPGDGDRADGLAERDHGRALDERDLHRTQGL